MNTHTRTKYIQTMEDHSPHSPGPSDSTDTLGEAVTVEVVDDLYRFWTIIRKIIAAIAVIFSIPAIVLSIIATFK